VNLASYTRERTASRMLAKFRDQGVDAELVEVMINDKPMYRIRVAGFANSREARAQIAPLEKQLGLEGVWIARK
jgi:cell division septation protein DedD